MTQAVRSIHGLEHAQEMLSITSVKLERVVNNPLQTERQRYKLLNDLSLAVITRLIVRFLLEAGSFVLRELKREGCASGCSAEKNGGGDALTSGTGSRGDFSFSCKEAAAVVLVGASQRETLWFEFGCRISN